ncbi:interferon gamma receptor 1-like isoform X2 [Scomber japonicus]|uniref:interferon gamma receptor 1-like isoform X2 n=1 Tax=Scomber japonicus TaxID=13676 RepID=UPI002305BE4D|nr:interferon gamma receptor 1-like isoform X2 [Scomber japonicus]
MDCLCHINVLFWIGLHLTAAQVPPPTNLTLNCRNFKNILTWTYEKPPPGLRFRVDIGSTDGGTYPPNVTVVPPTLQTDVSFLSSPSNTYYLEVTAVLEQKKSIANEIVFSYFKDSPATQKCSLDFPPVNVTTESEGLILISFTHPWLLYEENLKPKKVKRHKAGKNLPLFECKVVIINQLHAGPHDCSCEKSVCETKLQVNATQETHCVKMTGVLEKINVEAPGEYCTLPIPDSTIMYVGIGLASFAALAVIVYMVYLRKTKSSTSLPSSTTFPPMSPFRQTGQWTMGIKKEKILVPQVEPSSPTALLPEKEVDESTPADTPKDEYDVRMRIGVSTETDEGVGDEVRQQKDDYMQGTNLDEGDSETETYFEDHSSYERRQIVVELAPGEQAEGYRG